MVDRRFSPSLNELNRDRNSDQAWRDLSAAIWPIVLAAQSSFRMRESAEHLHEDLLTRLYQHADFTAFPGGRGFFAYIWAILRNLRVRESLALREIATDYLPESTTPALLPFEEVLLDELLITLQVRMNDDERELVGLLIGSGLEREEIAEVLGITANALAARICRLRIRIGEILESERRKK